MSTSETGDSREPLEQAAKRDFFYLLGLFCLSAPFCHCIMRTYIIIAKPYRM